MSCWGWNRYCRVAINYCLPVQSYEIWFINIFSEQAILWSGRVCVWCVGGAMTSWEGKRVKRGTERNVKKYRHSRLYRYSNVTWQKQTDIELKSGGIL